MIRKNLLHFIVLVSCFCLPCKSLFANPLNGCLLLPYSLPGQNVPKEFYELAKALSSDYYVDVNDWIKKQKTRNRERAIKEFKETILLLEGITTDNASIKRVLGNAISAANEVDAVVDEISKTPAPPSELETIVGSIIIGALAEDAWQGALGGGALGAQQGQARENYARLFQKLDASISKFGIASSLIPSLAKKFSAKPVKNERIGCDIDETFTAGIPDFVSIYNSGKELERVTVNVNLKGSNSTSDNFVFIEKWAEKTWIHIPCEGKATVTKIQKALISVFSEGYSTEFDYEYTKEEREKDIQGILKNVKIACNYQEFESGLIWNTERGVRLTMTGIPVLYKPKVTITFVSSGLLLPTSKTVSWDLDGLEAGVEKTFESKDFTSNPNKIVVKISVPYSEYEIKEVFTLNK